MPTQHDAAEIVEVLQTETGQDRRAEVRLAYPVSQFVAFHDEWQIPTTEMSHLVLCHDISTTGISFYQPSPPPFDHCTLALGRPPRLTFVKAKVVHYAPFASPNQDWVIGCVFINKVEAISQMTALSNASPKGE